MEIHLRVIPHVEQRIVNSSGDWYENPDGSWTICVSAERNPHEEFLGLLHELIEWYLCKARGISQLQVDQWDASYAGGPDRAGDDPRAPYHKEHYLATVIESILAAQLGVDWKAYTS